MGLSSRIEAGIATGSGRIASRALAAALAVALMAPVAARADANGTITQLAVGGSPAAGVPFTFTISAELANPSEGSYVFVGLEKASAGCPSAPGEAIFAGHEEPSTNPFPLQEPGPPLARGQYVLCAWLSKPDNAADVYDFKSLAFAVGDGGTIALSFSPTPVDGLWLRITASATNVPVFASAVGGHVAPAAAGW
jgi:hypothetical protein